jgi:hypothetical protein
MIGCRAADLIKASGRRPHPKAEWMAAAKANCQKLEKALAEREASMDGPSQPSVNGHRLMLG